MNRRLIFSLFAALPFVSSWASAKPEKDATADIAVRVNLNREQWHLFKKPGAPEAAVRLNQALNNAIATCDCPKSAYEYMKPVLARFKEYGAEDTEPRDYTLQPILRVAYRSHYNLLFGCDHSFGPR